MVESNKRTLIFVDVDDFELYQDLTKTPFFNKNIDLFTCAVLVGKYIVKKSEVINRQKDYIRVNDNLNNENMTILKCIAISSTENINILNDEKSLFGYCERYARTGIREIHEWYNDSTEDFYNILTEKLLEAFDEVNLEALE